MEQVLNDILKNYSASSYSLILFFARSCMITGRRFEKTGTACAGDFSTLGTGFRNNFRFALL